MRNIAKIISRLKKLRPIRIILFGSCARGDSDEHSDIDVIVVMETGKRFHDRLTEAHTLLNDIDERVDLLVYTPGEIAEMQNAGNAFISHALRGGKIVYEAGKKKRKAMV